MNPIPPTPVAIHSGDFCMGESFVIGVQPVSGYTANWYISTNLNTPIAQGDIFEREAQSTQSYQVHFVSNTAGCEGDYITIAVNMVECGDDLNFVRQRTVHTAGISTPEQIDGLTITQADQVTTYMDGLGRDIQIVNHQASPSQLDVVQPIQYDEYGRATKSYLSYVERADKQNNGGFKLDAIDAQKEFWGNTSRTNTPSETLPFSYTVLEASPLQRVLEQGSMGKIWNPTVVGGDGNTTKISYYLNNKSYGSEIRQFFWRFTNGEKVGGGDVLSTEFYGDRELSVVETLTPSTTSTYQRSETFTNGLGQTILQRVYNDTGSGIEELDTYYVYDELGQLRAIIPPKAVELVKDDPNWDLFAIEDGTGNTIFDNYCFVFYYDQRGRIIEKQVPGAEPLYMVYDQNDRLILTQDGQQRINSRWSFIKYDRYGREIMTGIYVDNDNKSRQDLQDEADAHGGDTFETGEIRDYPDEITLD
ncbi:MAG: DUF6443 domain-containing protein, partial [Bacteroidota bacterium]